MDRPVTDGHTQAKLRAGLLCLVVAFYVLEITPYLVRHGLALDGMIYATIARNLAEGRGSLWVPQFSQTLFAHFHEHPPLGLWLESGVFRLLGDGFYVEKIYSALTLALTLLLIARLWKRIDATRDTAGEYWLPLLLLFWMPFWSFVFRNNYLEGTVTVFACAAVLAQLHGLTRRGAFAWGWAAVGGVLIALGGLVKGPAALFPLTAIPCHWIALRLPVRRRAALLTLLVSGATGAVYGALMLLPVPRAALIAYFHTQLVTTFTGQRAVQFGRGHVLQMLDEALLHPVLGVAALVVAWRLLCRGRESTTGARDLRYALFFGLLGACASMPLMLSPRNYDHYILPSLPFFALALAGVAAPLLRDLLATMGAAARLRKPVTWLVAVAALACVATAAVLGVRDFGKRSDDSRPYLEDVQLTERYVGRGGTVFLCPALREDYLLMAYLARYARISVTGLGDRTRPAAGGYYLCDASGPGADTPPLESTGAKSRDLSLWKVR